MFQFEFIKYFTFVKDSSTSFSINTDTTSCILELLFIRNASGITDIHLSSVMISDLCHMAYFHS